MSTRDSEISDEMVRTYLRRRRVDVVEAGEALRLGDFAKLDMMGHRLRGNGGLFGFPELSRIGAALEIAATQRDLGQTTDLIAKFAAEVERQVMLVPHESCVGQGDE